MKCCDKYAGWYLVVFVDILGQQHSLRQIRGLPDKTDQKQTQEFAALLKKTVGVVEGLRDLFDRFFKGASKQFIDISKLTPEQKLLYEKSRSNPLKSHMFSDFVALFLSLRDNINKVPMRGVYLALTSAASTFLTMLASGHVIRGGVDIGIGLEICEGEIYGPVLSRAYELESKIAQYPRIVLGDEIVKYIQLQQERTEDDVFSTMNKKIAGLCSKLIAIDDDGYPFLDYLGEGFKQDIAANLDPHIVERAFEFVIRESESCKENKNTKLAFRYTLLRDYFEHHMHNWRDSS